jgi:hypothetical protein
VTVHIAEIGGACPVQAEGTVKGVPFYFRSRWDRWAMHIGADPLAAESWVYEELYSGGPMGAGYVSEQEAREFINKAADIWLKEQMCGGIK